MSRYHVNPETQRPNLCRASTPQGCKYYVEGEPEPPHFNTKEEARNYIEESSKEENTGKKMGGLSKESKNTPTASYEYDEAGNVMREEYSRMDEERGKIHHNPQGPAIVEYFDDGHVSRLEYMVDGNYITDKPAIIEYYPTGQKKREEYVDETGWTVQVDEYDPEGNLYVPEPLNSRPEKVDENLYKEVNARGETFYTNEDGKPHRMNGPAIITDKGEYWYQNGELHRVGQPAIVEDGRKEYYQYGKLHRLNGPAIVEEKLNVYAINGQLHRDGDKPAVIDFGKGRYEHHVHGEIHRDNGKPAIFTDNGYREWREHGKIHNLNGPAIIHEDDRPDEYFINDKKMSREEYRKEIIKRVQSGKPERSVRGNTQQIRVNDVLHNPHGPAMIREDGRQDYYTYGLRHNYNGPAVVFPSGTKEYWWKGEQVSQRKYNQLRDSENL